MADTHYHGGGCCLPIILLVIAYLLYRLLLQGA